MYLINCLRSDVALVLRSVRVKLNFDEEKCLILAIRLQKTCTTLGRQSSVLLMNGVWRDDRTGNPPRVCLWVVTTLEFLKFIRADRGLFRNVLWPHQLLQQSIMMRWINSVEEWSSLCLLNVCKHRKEAFFCKNPGKWLTQQNCSARPALSYQCRCIWCVTSYCIDLRS